MKFKEIYIDDNVVSFLKENIKQLSSLEKANWFMYKSCGVKLFFESENEVKELEESIIEYNYKVEESLRREFGDFQTNEALVNKILNYVLEKKINPEFLLEPTCGKGNFIIHSLKKIKSLKKIIGIEIYQPYVWETKFRILNLFLEHKIENKPDIEIIHTNVFNFNFERLAKNTKDLKTLIIGNPPWVTNSELGQISSTNLPPKSNFKKQNGFDAITGKGNFDIGEFISLMILNNFSNHNGYFGFLIKNSVLKNIIYDQNRNNYKINDIEKLVIDSKKEFNVSVDSCLFLSKLNQIPQYTCQVIDFYSLNKYTTFGWYKNAFVYSITDYKNSKDIEGKSKFIWRQGVKHDTSKIMELSSSNNHYINGLNETVDIEKDLLYGLLKSSDLKGNETNNYRKLIIITQKKVGQDTGYLKNNFPLTYEYLNKNKKWFEKRRSSIYNNKPLFSIFGIGDYSFAPYKIAISGLYKTSYFTLVLPDNNGKPLMLDDTCYFIGFDNLKFARIAHFLLNHEHTQKFLNSITFSDSKRPITKDVLMRIDLNSLYNLFDMDELIYSIKEIDLETLIEFGHLIREIPEIKQGKLF
ncbi:MAG: hypothetical protein KGY74_11185 [Candidatus Cloacimonetes bacterium]|nr:hypothetical protein [Candidatus Cloacimonadota bacterium]